MTLPPPPIYFPPARGRYTTTPDLHPLSADFGNGPIDGCLFQLDSRFGEFRAAKRAARAARFERIHLRDGFEGEASEAVCRLIVERLIAEWPAQFRWDGAALDCTLTGERLVFDPAMRLIENDSSIAPPYADAFDALCSQIGEDLAVVRREPSRGDWNAALHVSLPSRWAPEEKIGRSFLATHLPVPGMERSLKAAPAIVETFVHRGPFVRFNWGIAFDDLLDRHPEQPVTPFDGARFWLRVERQTLWPLPQVGAALFAIRVHTRPRRDLADEEIDALRSALLSLSPQSRVYKGFAAEFDALLLAL